MDVLNGRRWRSAVLAAACLGWFGLGLQLWLVLIMRWQEHASLLGGLMNFFSYFTVLSNTLVAAVLTAAVSARSDGCARLFRRPAMAGAAAASIVLVGATYSLLLRNLWNPQGLLWLANEILHDVMPIVFVGYWWLLVPKGHLRWQHLLWWALYPVAYFVWVLMRGAYLGVYPYPFFNVLQLGYGRVWLNALAILGVFWLIALLFKTLDRWLARSNAARGNVPPPR
jgi:hypothetical protein